MGKDPMDIIRKREAQQASQYETDLEREIAGLKREFEEQLRAYIAFLEANDYEGMRIYRWNRQEWAGVRLSHIERDGERGDSLMLLLDEKGSKLLRGSGSRGHTNQLGVKGDLYEEFDIDSVTTKYHADQIRDNIAIMQEAMKKE